ncbi:hypothetical protein BHM03_00021235 [Ensete ventricosum]|uniref:Retrotransposon gag domain-containing protein n=1 Tax=Ensete ventricosum TaxID=4639 RepID=A0A445MG67_ENSVE|nr:hypothetical protein BHM03_00021235 [Ensete ventricosum]
MASVDLIGAKLEAFETHMDDGLCALFAKFRLGRSSTPRRSQHGESFNRKENPPKKEEQVMDSSYPCIRMDFPRWEDGDPTRWISRAKQYFYYHRTSEASMVDIAAIHLGREAIQWYDWYKHTHGVPTWRQLKSGLLIHFRSTEYGNMNGQLVKIRQTSTVQEYQTRDHYCKRGKLLVIKPIEDLEPEDVDPELEKEDTKEELQPAINTIHALAGYTNSQSLKVNEFFEHQSITILIDIGSTNNFMDSKVAA